MATFKEINQKGSALVVVIVIAVIVLLGVVFWYAWQANKDDNGTNETNTTQDEAGQDVEEGFDDIEESAEGQRHTMTYSGNTYDPKDLTIKVGDTVEFRNDSDQEMWPASNVHPTHEVYSDFDSKEAIAPGSGWSFKFTQAGQWGYHDHLNPSATGTITVEE